MCRFFPCPSRSLSFSLSLSICLLSINFGTGKKKMSGMQSIPKQLADDWFVWSIKNEFKWNIRNSFYTTGDGIAPAAAADLSNTRERTMGRLVNAHVCICVFESPFLRNLKWFPIIFRACIYVCRTSYVCVLYCICLSMIARNQTSICRQIKYNIKGHKSNRFSCISFFLCDLISFGWLAVIYIAVVMMVTKFWWKCVDGCVCWMQLQLHEYQSKN